MAKLIAFINVCADVILWFSLPVSYGDSGEVSKCLGMLLEWLQPHIGDSIFGIAVLLKPIARFQVHIFSVFQTILFQDVHVVPNPM